MIAEASENREEDRKPSFVPFAILNGVFAALVLACISVRIAPAVESPDNAAVTFIFNRIGLIVELSAVVIGFIAVVKRNESSIDLFVSVSIIVKITDILQSLLYLTTTWPSNVSVKFINLELTLRVLYLLRIIILAVMYYLSLNLYEKVQRIDNTNRCRIRNGPQNQESPAQYQGTVELCNKDLFGHRIIVH